MSLTYLAGFRGASFWKSFLGATDLFLLSLFSRLWGTLLWHDALLSFKYIWTGEWGGADGGVDQREGGCRSSLRESRNIFSGDKRRVRFQESKKWNYFYYFLMLIYNCWQN